MTSATDTMAPADMAAASATSAPATDELVVEPGQIWADNDARSEGRTLRVDSVDASYAHCTILSDANDQEQSGSSRAGKTTTIQLNRMRATSTGYRLLPKVETTTLTFTFTVDIAAQIDQSIEDAAREMTQTITAYLTDQECPFLDDYGVTVAELAKYRETGDEPTWGGYEGPFVTAATVVPVTGA